MAWLIIFVEAAINGTGTRLGSYTSREWLIATVSACFNSGESLTTTLAYQMDSSGFVSLISYMSIVYGFLCDQFIFDEKFTVIELVAALVILAVALFITIYKLRQKQTQAALIEDQKVSEKNDNSYQAIK